jgi:hypothetical protein
MSLVLSYLMQPSPTITKEATALTATVNASTTSPIPGMTSGNPIFTETDKSTPPKPVVVNGTHGFQVSYSGSGVVKGRNFSAVGTVLIMPRSDKALDLNGHAVIAANNGEKGTYTFCSLGYTGAHGATKDNGTATFHTTSTGSLRVVNNLLLVFEDQIDKTGNGKALGWEWK